MKKSLIFGLLLVSTFGFSQNSVLPNQGLAVLQRYSGPVKVSVNEGLEAKDPAPIVIRNQEQFVQFTQSLPSGSNSDLLAQGPRFDWDKLMLLVVFNAQSLSFPPNVSSIEINSGKLIATIEYPEVKGLIEAKPMEIGSYGASLVARSDLPVIWKNPVRKAKETQPESMMIMATGNGGD